MSKEKHDLKLGVAKPSGWGIHFSEAVNLTAVTSGGVGMMSNKCEFLARAGVVAISLVSAVFAGGCNSNSNLIDHVTFQPSSNLETVRVSLVFTNNIQTSLSGNLEVGDYGFLFVNPYSPAEPFEVGFQLNTDIVNDQNYAKLKPTEVLPNGLPIGVGYPQVQVQGASPVSSQFDLYGYIDVRHASWLGTAAIFTFINDQNFPNGISISEVFMRDSDGNPGLIASVFGPSVDSSGKMTRAGGIAIFANFHQLITGHAVDANARSLTVYRPELLPIVSGPRAAEFQGNYTKLRAVESNLVRAFNSR